MRFLVSPDLPARFVRDRGGNFAIMLGIAAPLAIIASGVGIDYARILQAKGEMNAVIDAAVLATTQDLTMGVIPERDAEKAVRLFIDGNLQGKGIDKAKLRITRLAVDRTRRVVDLAVATDIPLTLMAITGRKVQRVTASTAAQYSSTTVEVSMALDITGSMADRITGDPSGKTKIRSLIDAASAGIDELAKATSPNDRRIRIGIAPYASSLNAGPYAWKATGGVSNRCVVERAGRDAFTDAGPGAAPVPGATACRDHEVAPLTTDYANLKSRIAKFTPSGMTAGHIGVAWASYMLSPKWNQVWPTNARPTPYRQPGVRKVAVLMTDGIFNTHYHWSGYASQTAASEAYALSICDRMKADGVTVYTIAFDSPSQAAAMMKKCATPDTASSQYFFDARNSAQLTDAFKAIARDITGLRLIN